MKKEERNRILLAVLAGAGVTAWLLIKSAMDEQSVTVIGGADGPTSIFVAGQATPGVYIGAAVAGVLLVGLVLYLILGRKKKR